MRMRKYFAFLKIDTILKFEISILVFASFVAGLA